MNKEEFEKEISICFQLPYHYLKDYGDALYDLLKSRENETWKHLKSLYVLSRQIDYRTPLREDGALCVGNLITGWGSLGYVLD